MYLMYEKFVNTKSSRWKAYIDLLPSNHDTPLFYTDAELRMLTGTGILEKVQHERARLRQKFQSSKDVILRYMSEDVWPSEALTYANYLWAIGILHTRMIWWEGEPHLVPMLDMINCAETKSGRGGATLRVHSTQRENNFAVTFASTSFAKNEEIFENYGQHNPYYFYSHGFVLLPNSKDCANINLPRITDPALQQLAQHYHVFREEEFCVSPTTGESRMGDLMALLRAMSLTQKQLTHYTGRAAPRLNLNEPLDKAHHRRSGAKLLEICQEHLQKFDTTPQEDLEWLEAQRNEQGRDTKPFREVQIVTYRLSQKKILMQLVQWADKFARKKKKKE